MFLPIKLYLCQTELFEIIIIISFLVNFSRQLSNGLLLESEWQQISRTFLSILAELNYAVILDGPDPSSFPISKVSIGITFTFMLHESESSVVYRFIIREEIIDILLLLGKFKSDYIYIYVYIYI